jgi:hypothetical protein
MVKMRNAVMKSPTSKLALFALGIALMATSPVTQQAPRPGQPQQPSDPTVIYPGLADGSGGTESYAPQYVPAFGNIGAASGEW